MGASWAALGDLGRKMERNGAIRSAKMSHQRFPDGKDRGGWVVNLTLCGPYPLRGVPTTHTLLLLADKLTTSSDSKTSK